MPIRSTKCTFRPAFAVRPGPDLGGEHTNRRAHEQERTRVVAVTALVAIVAFGVIGGSALARDGKKKPKKTAGQTQYGTWASTSTASASSSATRARRLSSRGSAVRAHLKHKSSLGPCAVVVRKGRARARITTRARTRPRQGQKRGKGARSASPELGRLGHRRRHDHEARLERARR